MMISQKKYRFRRQEIMRILGNGVLLLPSYPQRVYSNDLKMEYRQHSDRLYLTGFKE